MTEMPEICFLVGAGTWCAMGQRRRGRRGPRRASQSHPLASADQRGVFGTTSASFEGVNAAQPVLHNAYTTCAAQRLQLLLVGKADRSCTMDAFSATAVILQVSRVDKLIEHFRYDTINFVGTFRGPEMKMDHGVRSVASNSLYVTICMDLYDMGST